MKKGYAKVTDIQSKPGYVYGHFDGHVISRHEVPFTAVMFSNGSMGVFTTEKNVDGSVQVYGIKVELGDEFFLEYLPDGTVKEMYPACTAHLPEILLGDIVKDN